jgi:PAS domain-containing protein
VGLDALLSRIDLPGDLAAHVREELAFRQELERQLREATEELAAFFAHSPLALFVVDSRRRVRRMSCGAERFVGLPGRSALGGPAGDVLRCIHRLEHSEGCGKACQTCPLRLAVLETLRTGAPSPRIDAILPSDQRGDRQVRFSTTPTATDGEPMVLLCVEDLSDLHASARAAADIIREIPSGVFVYQYHPPESLTLKSANPAEDRLTGLQAQSLIGQELDVIWPEARSRGLTEVLLEVVRTGQPFETEAFEYRDERSEGVLRIRAFALPQDRLAVALESATQRCRGQRAL